MLISEWLQVNSAHANCRSGLKKAPGGGCVLITQSPLCMSAHTLLSAKQRACKKPKKETSYAICSWFQVHTQVKKKSRKAMDLKAVDSGSAVPNTSLPKKPTPFLLYSLLRGLIYRKCRSRIASLSLFYVQFSFSIQSSNTGDTSGMEHSKGGTSVGFFVSLGRYIRVESCQYYGVPHEAHSWFPPVRNFLLVTSDSHVSPRRVLSSHLWPSQDQSPTS